MPCVWCEKLSADNTVMMAFFQSVSDLIQQLSQDCNFKKPRKQLLPSNSTAECPSPHQPACIWSQIYLDRKFDFFSLVSRLLWANQIKSEVLAFNRPFGGHCRMLCLFLLRLESEEIINSELRVREDFPVDVVLTLGRTGNWSFYQILHVFGKKVCSSVS